ncbi:putative sodium-dependent lysophosphatidylcholine symporter 1-B [Apostichopus japonicus]|uniref:Putative sodium-dependent lysophosphatidylcholine symporter 1-B n=1 Tax=Stichopus japonicus TaxID=307972 RepID=A0A2G8KAL7_STIJA|nr:putative sodium-dependent lysophosphatidylcholine symporter 1-B [Apostichopus japonicus]
MASAVSTELEVTDVERSDEEATERTPLQGQLSTSGKKLRTRNKFAYGVGGMPYQLTNTVIGFYIAIFLLDTADLRPLYVSIIIFFGRFWDAVTDPIVGILITKTNTRFGKLKPWMAAAAPLAAGMYVLLWTVPDFESSVAGFFWYLFFYCGFQTVLTCYHLPYTALTMLISEEQQERDSATVFRMASEVVGNLLGNILMGQSILAFTRNEGGKDCLTGNETETNISHAIKREELGYQVGASMISVVVLVSAATVLFGTTELKINKGQRGKIPLRKALPKIISFKPYWTLIGAFLFFITAIQSIQGNFALYCKYTLHIDNYQNLIIVVLTSFPLLVVYAVLQPNQEWVMYVFSILAGNAIAVVQLVPWSMVPDVIDHFLIKHGQSYETIFYSFFVMFVKFATGVSLGISTMVLGLVGYKNGYCEQPEAVAFTLRLLVTAFPCLCIFIGYAFLWVYPITEDVRQKNKTILEIWRDDEDEGRRKTVKVSKEQRIRTRSFRTPSTTLL